LQRSLAVVQRSDPLVPASSGVSSSSSSFQRHSFEGIVLARRRRRGSSNRDFSSRANWMKPNVCVHHGGKMSQQSQSGVNGSESIRSISSFDSQKSVSFAFASLYREQDVGFFGTTI
jgi:hypothetical protein